MRQGGACRIERLLASGDAFVAQVARFAEADRAFEPKERLNALPLLATPVIPDQDCLG